jgi:hypothetical protein
MRIQQAVMECPGAPFVWVTDTYTNLHQNVIPSVLEGLRFLGWEENIHFVIDKIPPIEWQRQMYNVCDKYKQVMTFYNGFTFTFVSLDRPSIGAGRSYVGLFGDEVNTGQRLSLPTSARLYVVIAPDMAITPGTEVLALPPICLTLTMQANIPG